MITTYSHLNHPTNANQDPILTTKLQPLSSIRSLISRPRLLQHLDQGLEAKLTLICSPAGSGKTTLFIDWLRSPHGQEMPVAWISLDEGDNDPARFWRYVCAALERIDGSIGEQLARLLEAPSHMSETILIHFMNLLAESAQHLVLVLDDYHLITAEPIHHALSFLLDHMPAHIHLVFLTRFELALPLARLRVRGQVMEIRDADLRFTPEEVERFLTDTMGLSLAPMHIQALTQRTEGWIAGLQLAAIAMRNSPDIDAFVTSFTGNNRYIVDYLLEEVISQQSEETQTFLLSTAILGHMCASLCASVLDIHQEPVKQSPQSLAQPVDAGRYCQEMLEHLERTNLFLISLDHERQWYRYHHLFAEALLARLALFHPSLVARLHVRASIWHEQQGLLTKAIEHALAAMDTQRVSHLVEQVTSTSAYQEPPGPLANAASSHKQQLLIDPLSERELEALHLLATGTTNAGIAQKLIIAPATVKRHMSNIFSKLGVANRTQAVAQARDLGIL